MNGNAQDAEHNQEDLHSPKKPVWEEQQILAAIVSSSEDAIIGKDLNSIILSWNQTAEKLFGYSAEEAIGRNITIIIPPELAKEEEEIIRNVKNGRRIRPYQTVRMNRDGKKITVSLTISPVKNKQGEVIGASSIMRDITLQKKVENALRENQDLMNTFFDNTPAGLIIYDENNRYVRINDHAARLYGRKSDGIIGKHVSEILPPELARLTIQRNREVLKLGRPVNIGVYSARLPLDAAGKKETFWQGLRFPVKLAGSKVGIGIVSIEITEQIEAQEKTRISEEKFAKAFSSNPAAIAITSLDEGVFSDVNETWIKLLGYSRGETIGKTSKELSIWPKDSDRGRFVSELSTHGQIRGWEQEFFGKAGKKFVAQMSAQTMAIGGKKHVVTTLIDVTERKKLERQKDEFMGVASHELKTPVTSIKAYAQVLQLMFRRKKDVQSAALLEKLDSQIDRLSSLIADLLDVTRIESGKMQFREHYFDFNGLVGETVEEIQRTTPRHTIVQELDCSRTVYGDRERIGQVITNLLTNASKYSPKSKRIIVKTECRGERIILCVRDFGIGIPEEKQAKIFERFYRIEDGEGEDTYPGLGLGLYISSEIIRREHGSIWVESKEGNGSNFCFALPVSKKPEGGETK